MSIKYEMTADYDQLVLNILHYVMGNCNNELDSVSVHDLQNVMSYAEPDPKTEYKRFDGACTRLRKKEKHFHVVRRKTADRLVNHYYYDKHQRNPDFGNDTVRTIAELPYASDSVPKVRSAPAVPADPEPCEPTHPLTETTQLSPQKPLVMGYLLECGIFIPIERAGAVLRELQAMSDV